MKVENISINRFDSPVVWCSGSTWDSELFDENIPTTPVRSRVRPSFLPRLVHANLCIDMVFLYIFPGLIRPMHVEHGG